MPLQCAITQVRYLVPYGTVPVLYSLQYGYPTGKKTRVIYTREHASNDLWLPCSNKLLCYHVSQPKNFSNGRYEAIITGTYRSGEHSTPSQIVWKTLYGNQCCGSESFGLPHPDP
jgi:hypothetical protein